MIADHRFILSSSSLPFRSESTARHRRRRRERRGNRWTRGKLDMRFRVLEMPRERHPRAEKIVLSDRSAFGENTQRERNRGRYLSDKYQKIQKTIKGIPFNYFNTVNRLFTRLSVTVRTFLGLIVTNIFGRGFLNDVVMFLSAESTSIHGLHNQCPGIQ